MDNAAASWTAVYTSISRAAHQVLDPPPRVIDDPVAVGLVEGSRAEELLACADDFRSPIQCLARSLFIMRSRFAEDELYEAVRAGAGQYILLGAGLDTFAYRQPEWARWVRIIEVDHPASQARKQDYLRGAGIEIGQNVHFCPLDFEATKLSQGLATCGFDPQVPTFLSWLGVTQYLQLAAITRTLLDIQAFARGSRMVFSFIVADTDLDGVDAQAVQFFSQLAAARGEPWMTRFEPERLQQRLLDLGFAEVRSIDPGELERRYFAGREDQLRAPLFERLMRVRV